MPPLLKKGLKMIALLLLGFLAINGLPVKAQRINGLNSTPIDSVEAPQMSFHRPVNSSVWFEAGSSHLADTYLTPLHYDGQHFGLAFQRLQSLKYSPNDWHTELYGRLSTEHTRNPARNATLWNLSLEARWGMFRKFNLPAGIGLAPGLSLGADAGAIYLDRNGNNPLSAKGSVTLNISAIAWRSFFYKGWRLELRYQPTLPLTGVFFSPDYGELYYEIYLGNHRNLVHGAWPGNFFRLDNLLTLDITRGASALRLGYSNTVFSSKANHIVTRRITHAFVLGISTNWFSVSRTGNIPGTKLKFAL